MPDRMAIEIDNAALLEALSAVAGPEMQEAVDDAGKETAENICREARARVARRTGETQSHIVVVKARDGKGWVVWVEPDVMISHHTSQRSGRSHTQRVSYNALGGWLEFGTKFMTKRPFLHPAVALEEGPHLQRLYEAIQVEIDAHGLGE